MKPNELEQMRIDAGLTQKQAAFLVYTTDRQWRKWVSGEVIGKSEKSNYKARTELFEYKIQIGMASGMLHKYLDEIAALESKDV